VFSQPWFRLHTDKLAQRIGFGYATHAKHFAIFYIMISFFVRYLSITCDVKELKL